MFRNSFSFDDIPLGSSISKQEDIFKALAEGETKAAEIAKALKPKIPTICPGDIQIHCRAYDPQLWLDSQWQKKADEMFRIPGQKTLKQLAS